MGARDDAGVRSVTKAGTPPGRREFELTLLGPGYGESIVLHVGDGIWILVDSCLDEHGMPRALRYLESIGLDPARAVALIVATHWHDDHIRGMARLVEACGRAAFCCAGALRQEEFLVAVHALENRHLSVNGSGLREIYRVFTRLREGASKPTFAHPDRRIFFRDGCEIWSLSPGDASFRGFLESIGRLLPGAGQAKNRIPSLSPNQVAVALWIEVGDVAVLLGSDLEKQGWIEILESTARPAGKASAFKVPHHGSKSAHAQGVWSRMLDPEPFAVLTPWHRGGGALPTQDDVRRILSNTPNAYATADIGASPRVRARTNKTVDRTIRESGISLRSLPASSGAIRLRRPCGSGVQWSVEKFGSARHLNAATGAGG